MDFSSKVVLITGGAGGLGMAFAEILLSKGAKVCLGDLNQETGEKCVANLLETFPGKVIYVHCDVTSDESFKSSFEKCKEKLGKVNMLINNAGVNDDKSWEHTMNVNFGGPIRGTQLALETMGINKGYHGGHVVNVASLAGLMCVPFIPYYSSTKAGVVQYSRAVGHQFNVSYTGVNVQCLCPSVVQTTFLQSIAKKTWSPQAREAAVKAHESITPMKVETVSNDLIQLLEEGKVAAVMVVKYDKEPYYEDKYLNEALI